MTARLSLVLIRLPRDGLTQTAMVVRLSIRPIAEVGQTTTPSQPAEKHHTQSQNPDKPSHPLQIGPNRLQIGDNCVTFLIPLNF